MADASKMDRAIIVDTQFCEVVKSGVFPAPCSPTTLADVDLTQKQLLSCFDSQLTSRHLDLLARQLKQENKTFYTIGSSGHEAMAAVALAFRYNDMAFLHYRDAAFLLQRAKILPKINMPKDILYSLMADKRDPISGGRHKVLGSLPLFVPPQTSTIASHLPKAVGAAASIKRAQTLGVQSHLASDSVVLCCFGDASVNHSTALGAFNAAQWIVNAHYPLPLVFICEDNGLGVSVETPQDWIKSKMACQPNWHYIQADGLSLLTIYYAAKKAEHIARTLKQPVFLHLKMVRLLGHAGTDVESQYRDIHKIEADEFNDPLLHTARILLENKILTKDSIIRRYKAKYDALLELAKKIKIELLDSKKSVMSTIIPNIKKEERPKLPDCPNPKKREAVFGDHYKKFNHLLNLSQQLNYALTDIMLQYNNVIVFGEDVAKKGGVYRVTADLLQRFGPARIMDSLLDEQTILGQAIGHAQNGFIPIPEIQFLAYLHNAEDQLRGEASTLSFFSQGQFTNPMVVRIASFAYQKGFGGHFHNDNSIAVLRDIPGIIIVSPSNGADAVKLLRESVRLAYQEQRIVVFLEPIALYMQKDLLEKGDHIWAQTYPAIEEKIGLGELGVKGQAEGVVVISYANGYYLASQAAEILKAQHHIEIKTVDLRWLAPLNELAIIKAVQNARHIIIVDECRKTGSISEQLVSLLVEKLTPLPSIKCITAADSFITLGHSWRYLLPNKEQIVQAVLDALSNQ